MPLGRTLEMPRDLAVAAADRVWSCSRLFRARTKLAGYRLVAGDVPWTAGQGHEVRDLRRAGSAPRRTLYTVLFLMPQVMAVLAVLIAARGRLVSPDAGLTPGS